MSCHVSELDLRVHTVDNFNRNIANCLPSKLFCLISCIVLGRVNTSGALGTFMGILMNLLCSSGTSEKISNR